LRSNKIPNGAFKRRAVLREQMEGLCPDKFRRLRQTRIKNKIFASYGQSERGGHLNLYPYKKRLPHAMHSSPFEKLFLRNAPP
jgi:hypothetical protein